MNSVGEPSSWKIRFSSVVCNCHCTFVLTRVSTISIPRYICRTKNTRKYIGSVLLYSRHECGIMHFFPRNGPLSLASLSRCTKIPDFGWKLPEHFQADYDMHYDALSAANSAILVQWQIIFALQRRVWYLGNCLAVLGCRGNCIFCVIPAPGHRRQLSI